jgi:hypothetical protein
LVGGMPIQGKLTAPAPDFFQIAVVALQNEITTLG